MTCILRNIEKEKGIIFSISAISIFIITDIFIDIFGDQAINHFIKHIVIEFLIVAIGILAVIYINKFMKSIKANIKTKIKANKWEILSNQFMNKSKNYILKKFKEWNFSKSEQEIALLILKGKSSKEISEIRFTSDSTVRNQSSSIYIKSKLSGKNEFKGYFIKQFIGEIDIQ